MPVWSRGRPKKQSASEDHEQVDEVPIAAQSPGGNNDSRAAETPPDARLLEPLKEDPPNAYSPVQELMKYCQRVDQHKKEVEEAAHLIESLCRENEEKDKFLVNLYKELSVVKEQRDQEMLERWQLDEERKYLEGKVYEMEIELESARRNCFMLTEEKRECDRLIAEQREDLLANQNYIEELSKRLKKELEQGEAVRREKQTLNDTLKGERKKNELSTVVHAKVDVFQKEVSELKSQQSGYRSGGEERVLAAEQQMLAMRERLEQELREVQHEARTTRMELDSLQIRCRELHVENSQLQEELQRLRQHGGGGGGGGGQRVWQIREDNEHLRHQATIYRDDFLAERRDREKMVDQLAQLKIKLDTETSSLRLQMDTLHRERKKLRKENAALMTQLSLKTARENQRMDNSLRWQVAVCRTCALSPLADDILSFRVLPGCFSCVQEDIEHLRHQVFLKHIKTASHSTQHVNSRFPECPQLPANLPKVTMQILVYFTAQMGRWWKFIAYALGVEKQATLLADSQEAADSKCLTVLQTWIDQGPDVTWKNLLDTLWGLELRSTAIAICEKLDQMADVMQQ